MLFIGSKWSDTWYVRRIKNDRRSSRWCWDSCSRRLVYWFDSIKKCFRSLQCSGGKKSCKTCSWSIVFCGIIRCLYRTRADVVMFCECCNRWSWWAFYPGFITFYSLSVLWKLHLMVNEIYIQSSLKWITKMHSTEPFCVVKFGIEITIGRSTLLLIIELIIIRGVIIRSSSVFHRYTI